MADNSDDAFFQRLLATFQIEARERLQTLATAIVELEHAPAGAQQQVLIETIFREVHSLKGAARAVDRRELERLCQMLESVLSALKRAAFAFSPAIADLLLTAVDMLTRLLVSKDIDEAEMTTAVAALSRQLERAAQGGLVVPAFPDSSPPAAVQAVVAEAPGSSHFSADANPVEPAPLTVARSAETVRISAGKLDSLLRQAEGLLTAKLTAAQRALDIGDLADMFAALRREREKITDDVKTDRRSGADVAPHPAQLSLRKFQTVFEREEALLRSLEIKITALARAAERDAQALNGMVDTLLDDIKKASMLPLTAVLNIFPKLVRDLGRASGKEVDLVLEGGDIEIDRRILEEMRDPLIHLVRNAVDHGLEKAEQRRSKGKPARGTVTLAVRQEQGDRICITVADDGGGIDRERLRDAARRMQLGGENAVALDDERLLDYVFESGLSTSGTITDLSGRGLGLAIVRDTVEALGGTVNVESQLQAEDETEGRVGTRFELKLPLTLATYRGVHVRSGGRQFVFPLTHVEQVTTYSRTAVKTVKNREMVEWKGRGVALVRLADLLKLPASTPSEEASLPVVIAGAGDKGVAFLVDAIVGEQEVLVKSLGPQLPRVRNIAAATILGTGDVALVLNMADLMRAASNAAPARALRDAPSTSEPKSILVAEDSITSRMLLRGVLEAAGYRVAVAVDGEDAFGKLQAEPFDLLVSDVEMPRLNGFDLTARVRGDANLSALPVVLVTALASAADRERGIDVGASAYIVKSNFEEGHLLDVVGRLI